MGFLAYIFADKGSYIVLKRKSDAPGAADIIMPQAYAY